MRQHTYLAGIKFKLETLRIACFKVLIYFLLSLLLLLAFVLSQPDMIS